MAIASNGMIINATISETSTALPLKENLASPKASILLMKRPATTVQETTKIELNMKRPKFIRPITPLFSVSVGSSAL